MTDIVEVAEQVQGQVENLEEFYEVVKGAPNIKALAGTTFVVGLAVGGAVAYFVTKSIVQKIADERADAEIEDAKEFYNRRLHKRDELGKDMTPEQVMRQENGDEAADALLSYQGDDQDEALLEKTASKVRVVESPVDGTIMTTGTVTTKVNAFTGGQPFDLEVEKELRTKKAPYIITEEEFYADELQYEQSRLTYFAGDKTLIDEMDKPVDAVDRMVGEEHLGRFGAGCKDINVVHVRNDKLGMDFEITKDLGTFSDALELKEPTGELRHSDSRRREFRHGDG